MTTYGHRELGFFGGALVYILTYPVHSRLYQTAIPYPPLWIAEIINQLFLPSVPKSDVPSAREEEGREAVVERGSRNVPRAIEKMS